MKKKLYILQLTVAIILILFVSAPYFLPMMGLPPWGSTNIILNIMLLTVAAMIVYQLYRGWEGRMLYIYKLTVAIVCILVVLGPYFLSRLGISTWSAPNPILDLWLLALATMLIYHLYSGWNLKF